MSTTPRATKCGIDPLPIETYKFGTADVTSYLCNELGFSVGVDYRRWTGVTANHSYVRMRVVMLPKDVLIPATNSSFVDHILSENAAGMQFQEHVKKTLEPFMYPDNIGEIQNNPAVLQRLYEYGVYGDRLEEIKRYSKLDFSQEAGYFRIYLRPERIIADMLADPSSNKIDGSMAITRVIGETPETFQWEVQVTSNVGLTSDISIDRIFNMR